MSTDASECTDVQTTFFLNEERWKKFIERLAEPPQDNPALKRLLSTVPPWEKEPEVQK